MGLLRRLDAVDAEGRPTATGRRMARIGVHPRLARMIAGAPDPADAWLACRIAAPPRADPLAGRGDADLRSRLQAGHRGPFARAHALARDLARAAGARPTEDAATATAGALLALAYPDRVAR